MRATAASSAAVAVGALTPCMGKQSVEVKAAAAAAAAVAAAAGGDAVSAAWAVAHGIDAPEYEYAVGTPPMPNMPYVMTSVGGFVRGY